MRQLKLTIEEARNIVRGNDPNAVILLESRVFSSTFGIQCTCVFENGGGLWRLEYMDGQCEPFDEYKEPIRATPVRAVEKTLVVYELDQ